MTSFADRVDSGFAEVLQTRRHLHACPELSFEERETSAVIRERMRGLGADERPCPTASGGVFVIDGGTPGHTVLLRADIDGLPVDEATDHPWRSRVGGRMHACGHDAHVGMLLGVARVIAMCAGELPGRYLFVFQPGEERLSGARAMIDGGLLETLRPDRVIGCHVASVLPAGLVMLRPGIAMSDAEGLRFDLRGPGGHGASPGAAGDAIAAASESARGSPEVVAGMEYEGTPAVCSAGSRQAGRRATCCRRRRSSRARCARSRRARPLRSTTSRRCAGESATREASRWTSFTIMRPPW